MAQSCLLGFVSTRLNFSASVLSLGDDMSSKENVSTRTLLPGHFFPNDKLLEHFFPNDSLKIIFTENHSK